MTEKRQIYPKGDTSWFVKDRFGLFIHFGLYAMAARHEWIRKLERIPIEEYNKYFDRFDPDLFDAEEWARAAKHAGMKYAVLGTKHHEGFCMWDTAETDYKITNTPFKRDLVREFVDAFRKEGLKVGFYYSLLDWHHPHYSIDRMHPLSPRSSNPQDFEKVNIGRDMTKYAEYIRRQVKELMTQYGEVSVAWFDYSFVPKWKKEDLVWHDEVHGLGPGKWAEDWESEKLLKVIREHQPRVVLNDRMGIKGMGDVITPEQHQPHTGIQDAEGNAIIWEACQTFSGSWGYFRDEHTWKSIEQLLGMLIDGVSKGGNLLLNVGPTGRGKFDPRAMERLNGIGEWIQLHSRSIYNAGAAPEGIKAPVDCRYTYNKETNRLYLHLLAWPFGGVVLEGMGHEVAYAQFLHDASEVLMDYPKPEQPGDGMRGTLPQGSVELKLPIVKPNVIIPVIEIFLK